jgi:hypothetical protein
MRVEEGARRREGALEDLRSNATVMLLLHGVMCAGIGCHSCEDEGEPGWELSENWPEAQPPDSSQRRPDFSEIAPDDVAHVPREGTSVGDHEGAGPVGTIDLSHADVVLADRHRDATAVAYAGDVNGDGFDDLLLGFAGCCGMWQDDEFNHPNARGAVYLVYGGPRSSVLRRQALDERYAMFLGERIFDHLGSEVVGLGDVDGDDLEDFAVAAPREDLAEWPEEQKAPSRVYLFHGRRQRFREHAVAGDVADAIIEVEGPGLGREMAGGDFDGDGLADLAVSRRQPTSAGEPVYFFAGDVERRSGTYPVGGSEGTLALSDDDREFPKSLENAGDVDGDGVSDLILGSEHVEREKGEAYLVPGTERLLNGAHGVEALAYTFHRTDALGKSVGLRDIGGGDLDGDGFGEILIGDASGERDRLFIVRGERSLPESYGLSEDSLSIRPTGRVHRFPLAVAAGGDVNGDGFGDFLVSLSQRSSEEAGAVYLFYGRPDLTEFRTTDDADAVFVGATRLDRAGRGLALDGDFDGDGYDDIVVNTNRRRVYVVYGGP